MKTTRFTKAVVIFVALLAAGVALIAAAPASPAAEVRATLPFVGAALMSSGLTVMLLEGLGK